VKSNSGEAVPNASLRLLIFEDNREDVEMTLRTLRLAGFDVSADVVTTIEDVQQRLRSEAYDVVLADYQMPGATGLEAFEIVKAQGADTPFLMVTGYLGDERAVECLKQGMSDYVLKDRLARLPAAVRRALEERRLRQERVRAEEALRHSEEELRRRNHELQEQYRRAEAGSRAKSEFLANMSHELRSPLNGIIGFSEMMIDGKQGPVTEAQAQSLSRILSCGRHLLRIIDEVLDLSRIEAGKLEFRPEPVSISGLVSEVCDSLAPMAAGKSIGVELQVAAGLDVVLDPSRLKQIVYNYLSNALKFTAEGGRVTVAVAPEGSRHFRVSVRDTGAGICEAEQAGLFTDFHQLDSGKAKRFPGTGLGLALTRRMVEAQGGTVGLRSRVGEGSTFYAVLPRRAGDAHERETDSDR